MQKVLIDAHTHTVASGHAYSSLQEMAQAAADKGLQVLGITEHGPTIKGTCPLVYFRNMFVVPRQMYGVRILMGCEINILDTQGTLDLDDEHLDMLDIAIAGMHQKCWKGGTREENTQGLLKVIRHPKIHIISHPGDGTADLDFEPLVLAAKESHTLLEINNHSLAPQRKKPAARANNLEILRLCKKHGVPTILGSDAHISFQIADYERLLPLLAETDFPDELIMTCWPDQFFNYLGISPKPETLNPNPSALNS
ncbi:MAG: phosphatase, partial [Bacteroidaceae bacterium]|nr:phosphatase [Bacteroidaceae bacterium]